ncbi:MAG: IS66 family transposase zinc-finger binding domain-containing protein [Clostridium sp.]|nr:IS66 family transposase zinc-finger binding domain-containing protein [Clostridium sp.]
MKKEIRRELKIVPAKVSIVEHVTYVYSCRNCDYKSFLSPIIYFINDFLYLSTSFPCLSN